ncbi:hypothetical protein CFC21_009080 [Triticum aestivum]|uniref:Uncharacterized protein n=2 Tax=Triticum aestivum TaxID=4565 RepID=A0A3B5Z4F7_WHEAT|nr:hypothetical protein CFC21_009080 [Triticum aestivum]
MMARYCSASTSASCAAAGVDDGEPRLPVVSLAHLLQGPDAAPPEYLTLSLTPAGEAWPRREQPGEVTLNHINAPRDYLKLSVAPPDEDEPSTVAGGSLVASVASSGASETTLPPKKRKLAARVYQEASLAIVIHGDNKVTESSRTHGGDAEKRSPAAMTGQPIDAVPLRAVYRGHAGIVSHLSRLSHGVKEITTNDVASTSGSAAAAPFSIEPIDAVPLRAAPSPHIPHAAGAAPMELAWIRTALGLQPGHALYFIAQKRVECSDLEAQQSRFRIPSAAIDRLRPLLSDEGRHAANLDSLKPREKPKPQASGNGKAQGRKHGGLVVPLYINRAGDRMNARLTRWDSNEYTVLKYGNSQSFVRGSSLKVMDRIQIWAFLNPGLHLVIHKIDGGETTAAPSASAGGQQSAEQAPPGIV